MKSLRGTLIFGNRAMPYAIEGEGSTVTARVADREIILSAHPVTPGVWAVTCNGRWLEVHWAHDGSRAMLHADGQSYEFQSGREGRGAAPAPTAQGDLRAPMPGVVTRMLVRPGQVVSPGEPLYVLEAMKMEYVVRAVRACRVAGVTDPGTQVEKDAQVVEVEEEKEGIAPGVDDC